MTRYLVTGGAGFIGSNIAEALVAQGATVRVADNLSTGRRENMAAFIDQIEFLEGDLADLDIARAAVADVDYVLHQAAIPSVPRSVADPLLNNRAGTQATLNLLVAARDAGVKRLVFASSSSIYGDADDVATPKAETMLPRPLSPYGVSKLSAESYCLAFHTVYGFEAVALRYFNVFGPRQDPTSEYSAVIPKFITRVFDGQQPIIYGDGEQTRDFTYVGNIVAANLHALTHPNAPGQVFNIAMGQATSLNQLVTLIGELTGQPVTARHDPPRTGDILHSSADITRARTVLEFTPQISFLEGLRRTVAWYSTPK